LNIQFSKSILVNTVQILLVYLSLIINTNFATYYKNLYRLEII